MIIIYHCNNLVATVWDEESHTEIVRVPKKLTHCLLEIAIKFPQRRLLWCHNDYKSFCNFAAFDTIFHHKKILATYNPFDDHYLSKKVGYVNQSWYIKINKKVSFATWQMSSFLGGIAAEVILDLKNDLNFDDDFDYFLHSLAILAMPLGLFCYSEPKLLKNINGIAAEKKYYNPNLYVLFRFISQHKKKQWAFLLLLNLFLYERKMALLPFILSLFYKSRGLKENALATIEVASTRQVIGSKTIDVIIPTIGRKSYLLDVLNDLSSQTHLPENVIIVEQNPSEGSVSELDYLAGRKWPFRIKHKFIRQAGACNARNLALAETQSEWVFFGDDDNRFDNDLIDRVFAKIEQFGSEVVTTSYIQQHENFTFKNDMQWGTFGAGNSFVKKEALKNITFTSALEFGYGEDADFGMQLRNNGYDILYVPEPKIVHLKAAIGGFRTKPVLKWSSDFIQPKPSPTVMLYNISHNTQEQLFGYKTTLFFKYYAHQVIKNPFAYFKKFQQQWKQSIYWANELNKSS